MNFAKVLVLLSLNPPELPASDVTVPLSITIFRILKLALSTTYRFVPSVVIPLGYLNLAEVPVAIDAAPPCELEPARVVTVPLSITIFRILCVSVTYRFSPSVVIPIGQLKLADVPVALSAFPKEPGVPARVVTAPVEITIFRIV